MPVTAPAARNLSAAVRRRCSEASPSGTASSTAELRLKTASANAIPARPACSRSTSLAAIRSIQISMGCSMWP